MPARLPGSGRARQASREAVSRLVDRHRPRLVSLATVRDAEGGRDGESTFVGVAGSTGRVRRGREKPRSSGEVDRRDPDRSQAYRAPDRGGRPRTDPGPACRGAEADRGPRVATTRDLADAPAALR